MSNLSCDSVPNLREEPVAVVKSGPLVLAPGSKQWPSLSWRGGNLPKGLMYAKITLAHRLLLHLSETWLDCILSVSGSSR